MNLVHISRISLAPFALFAAILTGCSHGGKQTAADAPVVIQVPKPPIVGAAEWGSTPDPMTNETLHTVKFLTVHHAGELWKPTDVPEKKLVNLQSWGKTGRGWPDLPYHFLIAPDGRVFEGRSMDYAPETNTNYDTTGHIGVQLWGNFEEQKVTIEQLTALINTLAWLSSKYDVDPATIAGHLDRAQTACPGKDLYRYISEGHIGRWVAEIREGKTPEITLLPELADGPKVFVGQ